MSRNHYYLLAVFIVGAALWKAGVPLLPILLGAGLAGLWNLRAARRARAQ